MNIIEYKKSINKSSIMKKFILKLLVLTCLFIIAIILSKNNATKKWINKNILTKNIPFQSIKKSYNNYIGTILPFEKISNTEKVFNELLSYKEINKYKDGISLEVDNNYLIPNQYSGIVVFVGEKDDYGKTIIIESEEVLIQYSNINSKVKLYDQIEKGEYLGESIGNKLYLVFKKDGEIVDYKKYI